MKTRRRSSLFNRGEPLVWLTGGALVLSVFMIVGLLFLVFWQGLGTFWPKELVRVELEDGTAIMGELEREETYEPQPHVLNTLDDAQREAIEADDGRVVRKQYRTGNFDLTKSHFRWVSGFEVESTSTPEWALLLERLEYGRFYGVPEVFLVDGEPVAREPAPILAQLDRYHEESLERTEQIEEIEEIQSDQNDRIRDAQRQRTEAELDYGLKSPEWKEADERFKAVKAEIEEERKDLVKRIRELRAENERYKLRMKTADGATKDIAPADIVRYYTPNRTGFGERVGIYLSRWAEFLFDDPREANSEGGVWPAIIGTLVMTMIMALLVVPFGVLAALYLREYARQGTLVSIVRVAVNNLAGVPSIVFGVFGLGFFCYIVGGTIDQVFFPADVADGSPTFGKGGLMWASFTLALLTLPVVIVATEEALAAVPNSMREGSYACGASKWQTIRRIVLPRAAPGIMTGMILAVARGAGEVAPLMLVGAVKLAPKLPIDGEFPFVHPSRSFMHLGFHIYDLGFQSQNSQAARPMVFTTTLLLIAIVISLNILAVWVRARLRKTYEIG